VNEEIIRRLAPQVLGIGAYHAPMGQARADLLLGSPAGQRFLAGCLGHEFGDALLRRLGLGQVPGTARLAAGDGRPRAARRPRRRQDIPPQEVRAIVDSAVARGKWRGLLDLDELGLLAALAGELPGLAASAEGDETMLALLASAQQELRPVADALVSAPAARRWWEPATRVDQRFLEWDGWPRLAGSAVEQAVRDSMAAARAENAQALRRAPRRGNPIRNCWWSMPEFAVQSLTTGGFGDVSAIALARFVDAFTPLEETGATVWSVQIAPQARVMEIGGPEDWQTLVRTYPQDVTGTHGGEWRACSDVAGPWRLPDWEQVMEHYDGVHVTIGGYLGGGLALPAADGYTMLAGWRPDATIWLRDLTTGNRRLGRWHGSPQGSGGWDDLQDAWTPDGY
jgi:hypothetical protein